MIECTVRLTYPAHLLDQPLIFGLIRQYDLYTNILEAHVTKETGWLLVAMRGEREDVRRGLTWMAEQGVVVESRGEQP